MIYDIAAKKTRQHMAKQKWLTDEEKTFIEDAIKRGVKRDEICRVFNRSPSTIAAVAKGLGLVRPYNSKTPPAGPLLQAMEGEHE